MSIPLNNQRDKDLNAEQPNKNKTASKNLPQLSRRRFLQASAAAACLAASAAFSDSGKAEKTQDKNLSPLRRIATNKPNHTILENECGRNTIIYTNHAKPFDITQLPDNIDGITLDMGNYDPETPRRAYSAPGMHLNTPHYAPLKPYAVQHQIPIYSLDYASLGSLQSLAVDLGISSTEGIASILILRDLIRERLSKDTIVPVLDQDSINNKHMGVGMVGMYLASPLATSFARRLSVDTGLGNNMTETLSHVSNVIHPETAQLATKLRDAIIAVKTRNIMQKSLQEQGKSFNMVTLLGANHVEYAHYMQQPIDEVLQYLNLMKYFLQNGQSPQSVFLIQRELPINSAGFKLDMWEVPELKSLLDGMTEQQIVMGD